MALKSFGQVTVTSAGTPVRCTINEDVPEARYGVQSVSVQALKGNTGDNIYLGNADMNTGSLDGVYAIIPKGSQGYVVIQMAPAGINVNELFLDGDADGDAALVTATEQ